MEFGDIDTNLETMYSWGSVSNGELGLGGLEKPHVALPSKVPLTNTSRYVDVREGEMGGV